MLEKLKISTFKNLRKLISMIKYIKDYDAIVMLDKTANFCLVRERNVFNVNEIMYHMQ